MSLLQRIVFVCSVCLFWLAVFGSLGHTLLRRYPMDGVFSVQTNLVETNPWIFRFLPSDRVKDLSPDVDGVAGQRIVQDPVYVNANVPGSYEMADMEIDFHPQAQPLIEIGVVQDGATESSMQPLYFAGLETSAWKPTVTSSTMGYSHVPISDRVVWHATATYPLLEDRGGVATTTAVSLRGAHDFYVVPMDGQLHVTLEFQLANRATASSQTISVRVYRGDEEFVERAFVLQISREQRMTQVFSHQIDLSKAPPGVYRIAVRASDDVFTRSITTPSARWVVGPRVFLGDVVGYQKETRGVTMWTTGRHVVAETLHQEGLQTIRVGQESFQLTQTHEPMYMHRREIGQTPVKVDVPRGDVKMTWDGFVAFRPEAYFEPRERRLTDATQLQTEGIQLVRTTYEHPTNLGNGWWRGRFHVALLPQTTHLRFVISAPGLEARDTSVDVRNIRVIYRRPAGTWSDWKHVLWEELRRSWRSVKTAT